MALHQLSEHHVEAEAGGPIATNLVPCGDTAIGSIPMGRYLALVQEGSGQALEHTSRRIACWLQQQHEVTSGPIYVHLLDLDSARRELLVSIQRKIIAGAGPEQRELNAIEHESLHAVLQALARLGKSAELLRGAPQRASTSEDACRRTARARRRSS